MAGSKIAVVGAGGVGSTTAYAALMSGVAHQVALYDRSAARVQAEVLDLEHGLLFVPTASIVGSDDISVCSGADVIVVTAGAKQSPGESRLDLAGRNADLFRDLIPKLAEGSPEAVLMIITNPVDVLTYAAWKLSEFPNSRVFGSGTLLDTSRLRFLLAQRCGVAETNVHVTIAGEHGDSAFVLWSSALIGNVPLEHWRFEGGEGLSAGELDELTDQVKHAAQEIIRGKGATTFAIGLAVTSILEAVVGDAHRAIPVSSLQRGLHGVSDVCLSLPVVVGSPGIERDFEIPMTEEERRLLAVSADVIGRITRSIGF